MDRCVRHTVAGHDGKTIVAIAPSAGDLIAAKLYRGDPKDVTFAARCFRHGLAKPSFVKKIIEETFSPELRELALTRLDTAMKSQNDPSSIDQKLSMSVLMQRRKVETR